MRHWPMLGMLVVACLSISERAIANINVGNPAPPFTKNALDVPPPAARSLSDYPGQVIILFLLGYN